MMEILPHGANHRPRGIIMKTAILAAFFIVAVWFGRGLAGESNLPVLIALGLLALAILAPDPIRGLYLAYPIMFLIPFGVLWFDFPLFNSPLDIIVMLTAILGGIRFVGKKKSLPKSRIYIPILVCIGILTAYALLGHGEVAGFRLFRFVQGLWPFVLVVMLLETPKQARNVLASLLATFVILAFLWLPGLITAGEFGANLIRRSSELKSTSRGLSGLSLSYSSSNLGYLTLLAIAFVAVMALGWAMTARKSKAILTAGTLLLFAVVLWASYASAVVALLAGTGLVFLFFLLSRSVRPASLAAFMIVVIIAVTIFIIILPQGKTTMERIAKPSQDESASFRMWAFSQGVGAFRANPLIGYGAYNKEKYVAGGYVLAGHNTFITAAYEFGLLFMIPYALLFILAAMGFFRLIKRARRKMEKGLAIGMAAGFGAAVVTGFITLVFGEPAQDAIIWLFIGLMTVWNSWLDSDPEAQLV